MDSGGSSYIKEWGRASAPYQDHGDEDVNIEFTEHGVFLRCQGLVCGPFRSLAEVDPLEVGDKLGVEPKRVLHALLRVYGAVPSRNGRPLGEETLKCEGDICGLCRHFQQPGCDRLVSPYHEACERFSPLVARLGGKDWKRILTALRISGRLYLSKTTWVEVRHQNGKAIRLRLVEKGRPTTGWITLREPEDLRTSRNAKPFRDQLKRLFRKSCSRKLETLVAALQESGLVQHGKAEKKVPLETGNSQSNGEPKLTAEEKERAERLLESPNILDYVVRYGRRRLVGEDRSLKLNFITIVSSRTRYPISTILDGVSGSGKNESIRAILPLIPREWVFSFTTSTPEALKYIPKDFEGCLLIYEVEGVSSKTGSLGLRAIGEGERLVTIYPMRDEKTGRMYLGKAETGAKNFLSTTSELDISPDLHRRVLRYTMDHSTKLTKRVIAKKLRDAQLPESLRHVLKPDENEFPYTEKDFQNALRLNDWKAEVILFPPTQLLGLVNMAATTEMEVALRSHVDRILDFIRVLALLHQRRRLRLRVGEHRYVVAHPEDVETALDILAPVISETVMRIGGRQREVLRLFGRYEVLDKHIVARELKISEDTAYRYLKSLTKQGYLEEDVSTRPYTYKLLREGRERFGILENPSSYRLFWLKSLQKLLKELSRIQMEGVPIRIEGLEHLKNTDLVDDIQIRDIHLNIEESTSEEEGEKKLGFSEIPREDGGRGKTCGSCVNFRANRCIRHPEWVVVTPTSTMAEGCEEYGPRDPLDELVERYPAFFIDLVKHRGVGRDSTLVRAETLWLLADRHDLETGTVNSLVESGVLTPAENVCFRVNVARIEEAIRRVWGGSSGESPRG